MDINICKTLDEKISLIPGAYSNIGLRRDRETDATTSDSSKRRKFDHLEHQNVVVVQLENHCHREIDVHSSQKDVSSPEFGDHVVSSSCFKDCLSVDLKTELLFKTETSMSSNDGFSKETSSSSEICLDSDEMESSSTLNTNPLPPSRRKPSTAVNAPTAAEIDEFFSIIEKKEQKRFADKYNYDIVNDVPMEGRYKWVLLKQ